VRGSAAVSDGKGGVELGYTGLWDYIMITEFDGIKPESAAI
jgi:hypothetical protein